MKKIHLFLKYSVCCRGTTLSVKVISSVNYYSFSFILYSSCLYLHLPPYGYLTRKVLGWLILTTIQNDYRESLTFGLWSILLKDSTA